MYDCSSDLTEYHDGKVPLPQEKRTEMRKRRDANRDRLLSGLVKGKKPAPSAFHSQGSYAMKTMVQDSEKDFDIDDGVYFEKVDLRDANGAETTAADARSMVRDGLKDDRFNKQPAARENCVRVYYNEGYHIDVPVYRRSEVLGTERVELASADWKDSDARGVTEWFEQENTRLSPQGTGSGQFRHVVRLIKKFARSRQAWIGSNASGFLITKLCSEVFVGEKDRIDKALRGAMTAIRDRLDRDLVVSHPVVAGETITKGPSDTKAIFLREALRENLPFLEALDAGDCTRAQALKAWGKVFNDDWFTERGTDGTKGSVPTILTGSSDYPAVNKRGGDRYAHRP
jgi:hypothetical protein